MLLTKINWIIDEHDIRYIKEFVDSQNNKSFVKYRITKNVDVSILSFSKNIFWKAMISCLLTTQQRSGPNSPVTQFITSEPFPLNYKKSMNQARLNEFVTDTITNFGGLRRANRIAEEVHNNLLWLDEKGWEIIEKFAKKLIVPKKHKPQLPDRVIERNAANVVMDNLKGFGPKQSRNLWQSLGLTRFEIPIDSRITKWLNQMNFPIRLSAGALSDTNYYNFLMDGIQQLCNASSVYPCVLDAAIFSSFDPEWPEDKLIW